MLAACGLEAAAIDVSSTTLAVMLDERAKGAVARLVSSRGQELGAAMGLGVERDTLGDVALGQRRDAPCAWLFCLEEVAGYVCASFESAGRAAVRLSVETEAPGILPPEGTALRATVQQLRLDAVVAAACRLSRSEAQRLIAAGLVKLNHVPNLRADARLEAGDLLSVRGHGRVRVDALQGESRRGRQVVSLFVYGKK